MGKTELFTKIGMNPFLLLTRAFSQKAMFFSKCIAFRAFCPKLDTLRKNQLFPKKQS